MKATELLFLSLGFFSTCIADERKIIEVSNKEPLVLEPFEVFGNNDLKIHVYYVEVRDSADNVISRKVGHVMVKELSGTARKAGLRINMEIYAINDLKPKGMEVEAFYSACRKMGDPEGITVTVPGFLALPKKIYVELSKPKPASLVSGNPQRTQ